MEHIVGLPDTQLKSVLSQEVFRYLDATDTLRWSKMSRFWKSEGARFYRTFAKNLSLMHGILDAKTKQETADIAAITDLAEKQRKLNERKKKLDVLKIEGMETTYFYIHNVQTIDCVLMKLEEYYYDEQMVTGAFEQIRSHLGLPKHEERVKLKQLEVKASYLFFLKWLDPQIMFITGASQKSVDEFEKIAHVDKIIIGWEAECLLVPKFFKALTSPKLTCNMKTLETLDWAQIAEIIKEWHNMTRTIEEYQFISLPSLALMANLTNFDVNQKMEALAVLVGDCATSHAHHMHNPPEVLAAALKIVQKEGPTELYVGLKREESRCTLYLAPFKK